MNYNQYFDIELYLIFRLMYCGVVHSTYSIRLSIDDCSRQWLTTDSSCHVEMIKNIIKQLQCANETSTKYLKWNLISISNKSVFFFAVSHICGFIQSYALIPQCIFDLNLSNSIRFYPASKWNRCLNFSTHISWILRKLQPYKKKCDFFTFGIGNWYIILKKIIRLITTITVSLNGVFQKVLMINKFTEIANQTCVCDSWTNCYEFHAENCSKVFVSHATSVTNNTVFASYIRWKIIKIVETTNWRYIYNHAALATFFNAHIIKRNLSSINYAELKQANKTQKWIYEFSTCKK